MNTTATSQQPKPDHQINGAFLLVRLLQQQGITHVAGMPGGANLPIYDALSQSDIKHVQARHEQGAGFFAQGMARASGKPQVCLASSGPGASNLVTAVADAHLDSIPLIAITGQVPSAMIGTDAFQELDTFALMKPITKHNWLVRSAAELLEVIPQAFRAATEGRPGPVSIDIPKDVQTETITLSELPVISKPATSPIARDDQITELLQRIHQSHKPVIMAGGGIVYGDATEVFRQFVESMQIPVVQTFMGLGVLPNDHPLRMGMLGMHGAPYTNMIMEECDLVIGMGVRFDDRATGKLAEFCPQADIIHIEIDAREIRKLVRPVLSIHADIKHVLMAAMKHAKEDTRPLWHQRVNQLRDHHPLIMEGADELFRPYGAIRQVARYAEETANITTDVGQHQMWVAQAYPFERPRQWCSSGGLGTMGFGLPAAIGMALAQPERMVVCFTGDGSLMINIQELATAAELNLNIKIILMNNGHLGLVRQQQALFYDRNLTAVEFQAKMDFCRVAEGMGIEGIDLALSNEPLRDLKNAMQQTGPRLINIPISETEMVFPMVAPGGANRDMIHREG